MRWRDSEWTGHPSEMDRNLLRKKGSRHRCLAFVAMAGYICGECLNLLQSSTAIDRPILGTKDACGAIC
jgi:hypothetical protein